MHNNHKMGSSDSLLKTIREIMEKKHTTPETPKEKSLAKLAHPKDKITHKDVLVGRGVLKKENSGDRMGVIVGTRKEKVELEPKLKESNVYESTSSMERIHADLIKHVPVGHHYWMDIHHSKGPLSDKDHEDHKQTARSDEVRIKVSHHRDEDGYHHVLIHSPHKEDVKAAADHLYDDKSVMKKREDDDAHYAKSIKEQVIGGKHSTYTIKTSGDQKNIHKEMMKHVNPGYHHWIGQHSKKGPISDDDHKEIKRVANANDANVHVSSSQDEEGYHHVLIHSSTRESAKSTADDLYDEGGSVTRHRPKKSTRNEDVQHVTERKLTGAETEKKEKLVLSLKKRMGGFKKRYGERAKDVMYATATKMAKEELNIDEASSEFKATGRKHPDGSITVRVERDGRTQVHTGKPAYVHKQIMDRYKIPSTSINMKEASDEQIGEMSGQYNESKTLGKYSFSGSLGKYAFSGGNPKSDSKSKPEKTYTFKGKVELPPKRSKQVAEVSTGMANRYLSKTQDDDTRKVGRALALKKKWGGKVGGTEAPKVPTKD